MADDPLLIIQLPKGSAVERQLREQPPQSVSSGEVVLIAGPTDDQGALEAAAAGEVVMSVPSPEGLARDAAEVRRVIGLAGTGVQPLVIAVEAAEELREDELGAVLEAARHTRRAVILRIIRDG